MFNSGKMLKRLPVVIWRCFLKPLDLQLASSTRCRATESCSQHRVAWQVCVCVIPKLGMSAPASLIMIDKDNIKVGHTGRSPMK